MPTASEAASNKSRRQPPAGNPDARGATSASARKHLLLAGVLFALDAFVLNQGAIAAITLLAVLVGIFPVAMYRWLRHGDRRHLGTSLIYTVAALLVFAANHVNNKIAEVRAAELISRVEHYKADTGAYPASLAALVPAYIDHVPRAKYTIFFAEFTYQSRPGMTTLAYMDLPPFGRPSYDFDNRNWYYLD